MDLFHTMLKILIFWNLTIQIDYESCIIIHKKSQFVILNKIIKQLLAKHFFCYKVSLIFYSSNSGNDYVSLLLLKFSL